MKYRKKPVVIEAHQFDGTTESLAFITNWSEGVACDAREEVVGNKVMMEIDTLEGAMYVAPGDYVILGVKGEFYPCKPDIFWMTYEVANVV